ncbi:MAG: hypothetical protein QM504_12320 [Pseudomonadota bacterium]
MAKHISDTDIEKIVSLIDGWDDDVKFTWEKLCDRAKDHLSIMTTRQTLQKFNRIKDAYEQKKILLRQNGKVKSKPVPSLNIAAKRIAKLDAENTRLKREQEQLLSQFMVWQYNAYANGMSMEQLNNPMPMKNTRKNVD